MSGVNRGGVSGQFYGLEEPVKYVIEGADGTSGVEVSKIIEAKTPEEAAQRAARAGLMVAKIRPESPAITPAGAKGKSALDKYQASAAVTQTMGILVMIGGALGVVAGILHALSAASAASSSAEGVAMFAAGISSIIAGGFIRTLGTIVAALGEIAANTSRQ